MSRRALIRAGALGAIGAYAVGASGLADTALGARKVQVGGTTLNWLTWSDHYFTNQVQKVKNSTKIGAHIQLISDDADAYTRVKQGGSQWDMSSEDALWVPLFYKQGLIQALDLTELPVS
jgi:spermidine/putrescine-binding protein